MRKVFYFTENEKIRTLLGYFAVKQGNVFHYTRTDAAENIVGGAVRFTRADTLVDKSEIEYGLTILEERLGEDSRFSSLPDAIRERLRRCYVLSLSYDPDNPYLKEQYSGAGGAILEFKKLPHYSHGFWHVTPNTDGSYRLHHFKDLYEVFEGNVIYDPDVQLEIIDLIIEILPEMIDGEPHIADYASFTFNYLLRPFLLSKNSNFSPEDEYRIVLVAKEATDDRFEVTTSDAETERIYVEARMPGSAIPSILDNSDT